MKHTRHYLLAVAFIFALGGLQTAGAALVTSDLGNDSPGFASGSTPDAGSVGAALAGPEPFDQGYGSDTLAFQGSFSGSWTHNYAPIADTILSASITIGIYDHDSAASGSQLMSFGVGGSNLTSSLDGLFEAAGQGLDGMYNEYTVDLGAALFPVLASGSVDAALALQGPGLQTCTLSFACPGETLPFVSETASNGAVLLFSSLSIETGEIPPIPIPAAAPLFLSALALMGLYRRRVMRGRA